MDHSLDARRCPTASKEELCSTRRFGLPDDYRGTFHTGVRFARDP
jgi:hypothetical protein